MTSQNRLDSWDQKGHGYNLRIDPRTGLPEFYDEKALLDKWDKASLVGKLEILTKDLNFKRRSRAFEKAGNIAFRRLAAAKGFDLDTAQLGAGVYQALRDLWDHGRLLAGIESWWDDPEDQKAIDKGYRDYKAGVGK